MSQRGEGMSKFGIWKDDPENGRTDDTSEKHNVILLDIPLKMLQILNRIIFI